VGFTVVPPIDRLRANTPSRELRGIETSIIARRLHRRHQPFRAFRPSRRSGTRRRIWSRSL